ncbi:MAG: hypothetical protein ACM37W_10840 [Actinomycetota bacterium]
MHLSCLLLLISLGWAVVPPAEAFFCRNTNHHEICILTIKRSAKYHWEYRAAVRIDGIERPIEVYNCRDRTRKQPDGTLVPFQPKDAGELICDILPK